MKLSEVMYQDLSSFLFILSYFTFSFSAMEKRDSLWKQSWLTWWEAGGCCMAPGILGFGRTTGPALRWACCLWAMTCCCMCWSRSCAKLICVGNLESWLEGKLPGGCKFGSITGLLGICGGVSLSSITKEPILAKINEINTKVWQLTEMPSHCQQYAVWLEPKAFLK